MRTLPDEKERQAVEEELDVNLLVEASAGTGKTSCIVRRMLSLIKKGKCDVSQMAAMTFTRKAAAEMKWRFQESLEREAQKARGAERERLKDALYNIDACFIGTIHSFCASLLRERPVEAGLDPTFTELDENEDRMLRDRAWNEFLAERSLEADKDIDELIGLGVDPWDLKDSFARFLDYPDVEEWPLPGEDFSIDVDRYSSCLAEFLGRAEEAVSRLENTNTTCELMRALARAVRMAGHGEDIRDVRALHKFFSLFAKELKITKTHWTNQGFSREEIDGILKACVDFSEVARCFLADFCTLRYRPAMKVFMKARGYYEEMKRRESSLNFQDLLTMAACLVRENPGVRRYFAERYRRILVDEFQDTDPIQAEVIVLLASEDYEAKDWRRCGIRKGALFIVGDPKQSIYRFRRADVSIYNEVKELYFRNPFDECVRGDRSAPGYSLSLVTSFRSTPEMVAWVNEVFGSRGCEDSSAGATHFPAEPTEVSPAYSPLESLEEVGSEGRLSGVLKFRVSEESAKSQASRVSFDAEVVAATVGGWLRSADPAGQGMSPEDFLVITPQKKNLAGLSVGLKKIGIPLQITGGRSLNEIPELRLLYLCLKAINRPEDPVALLAVLRSELFGVSDAELYEFKRGGGKFSFMANGKTILKDSPESLRTAFRKLNEWSRDLRRMSISVVCMRILEDSGLLARACSREGGELDAGGLYKAVEVLGSIQGQILSNDDYIEFLRQATGDSPPVEYDSLPAVAPRFPGVRIMNLHKAKGLEASCVFLVGPGGLGESRDPDIHIDRSGERVKGYIAITKRKDRFRWETLAHPDGWKEIMEREREFEKAEMLRLKYVAATRAKRFLVVSEKRDGKGRDGLWEELCAKIQREVDIPDYESFVLNSMEEQPEPDIDFGSMFREIGERKDELKSPTYEIILPSELHAPASPLAEELELEVERDIFGDAQEDEGGGGALLGTLVHRLLSEAMKDPSVDVWDMALRLSSTSEEEREMAERASGLVRKIISSALWERAMRSQARLAEFPFVIWTARDSNKPVLVKGVIDLAFKEEGEWVVVDYKTESASDSSAERMLDRYGIQLELYASALENITGEKVKETAIFSLAGRGRVLSVKR